MRLLELQSGRDMRAKDALRRAVALDPFNDRAANSLKLAEELLTYRTIESEHFIVRYRDGIDAVLAPEMLPVLERIHAEVAGPDAFDHEPDRKTVIELMPDHEWFGVRITGMPRIHTMAASTGPVIAMESPQDGPGHPIGTYDWPRTLKHEYAHTVTLSRTRNRIPHWFTEAAAVWVEDAPRPPQWWSLLAAAYDAGRLFTLPAQAATYERIVKEADCIALSEAYRFLRKASMDQSKSMAAMARSILDLSDILQKRRN